MCPRPRRPISTGRSTAARTAFDEGPWPTMTHADRAEFLRGHRRRPARSGPTTSGRSGPASRAPSTSSPSTARRVRPAGFDYYAGLAKTFPFEERAQPTHGRVRSAGARAGGRRRRHHPLERTDRPHHLQAGPGPPGRLHGGAQVLTGGPWRRLRGRRDRRGHRPSRRGAQRGHRRSRGLRAAGPRPSGGQDHLHRLDRRRAADRLDLRGAHRPVHPRAGRQVGCPHPRRHGPAARPPPPWPGPSACCRARCARR